jgi:hypothetical protein
MRAHFSSTAIKLSGALTIGLLASGIHAPKAQAITYQQLLSTGQNVPGSNPLVDRFGSIAIDQNQTIAAVVGTAAEPGSFGSGKGLQTFQGVYRFTPTTRTPQLIEGGLTARFTNGEQKTDFPNLSINNGAIAYFINFSKIAPPQEIQLPKTELKVAIDASITTLLTANQLTPPSESKIQTNTIAQTDRTAFVLGQKQSPAEPTPQRSGVLSITQPNQVVSAIDSADPIFSTNPLFSSNPFDPFRENNTVRASNGNLLLVTQTEPGYRVIEKLTTGALREVERGSKSCGAAIWNTAIVFCGIESKPSNPYRLMVRLAGNRAFQQIPVPSGIAISQPSIQSRTVIFRGTQENKVDAIYSSFNGQTAQRLIGTGNKLDGKVISRLRLSDQGQSLNGKAIVFVATFTDGSIALYRAIL